MCLCTIYFLANPRQTRLRTLFSIYTLTCGLQWFRGARKLVISTFPCGFLALTWGDREIFLRNHRLRGLYGIV